MIEHQHFASHSDLASESQKTTYSEIEKFVKKCKTHRNIIDQEAGYISQLWKQSIGANPYGSTHTYLNVVCQSAVEVAACLRRSLLLRSNRCAVLT